MTLQTNHTALLLGGSATTISGSHETSLLLIINFNKSYQLWTFSLERNIHSPSQTTLAMFTSISHRDFQKDLLTVSYFDPSNVRPVTGEDLVCRYQGIMGNFREFIQEFMKVSPQFSDVSCDMDKFVCHWKELCALSKLDPILFENVFQDVRNASTNIRNDVLRIKENLEDSVNVHLDLYLCYPYWIVPDVPKDLANRVGALMNVLEDSLYRLRELMDANKARIDRYSDQRKFILGQ